MGLLNISGPRPIEDPDPATDTSERECSKKSVQQGHSPFDARSVLSVRERERREERQVCEPEGGKMARTPLAAFFNIPQMDWKDIQIQANYRLIEELSASQKLLRAHLSIRKNFDGN
jgi:hypothetical protein